MRNVLDVDVSFYETCRSSISSRTVNLFDYLSTIDETYCTTLEKLRFEQDESNWAMIKKQLPAITPSGVFNLRSAQGLVKHSGLICLDIDQKDNIHISNFAELKEELKKIKNVAYCGRSASGKGYFILIPIAFPDKHKQHFLALEKSLADLGINVDKACSDVCRLRFYSFDEDAAFNLNAKPYSDLYSGRLISNGKIASSSAKSKEEVCSLIDAITRSSIDITGDYVQWRNIGFAFCSEYGEDGRDYFHAVSAVSSKYDFYETDRQYSSCLSNIGEGITIKSFFFYCKKYL